MQKQLKKLSEIAKRVGATRSFNPDFWYFSGDCPGCSRGDIVVGPLPYGGAELFCTGSCSLEDLLKAARVTEKDLSA